MTKSATPIRIIRERVITRRPRVGTEIQVLAITWQIPPNPPQVLFVDESELPDRVWRRSNPTIEKIPEPIREQGNAKRRELILAARQRRGRDRVTTI